MLSATMELSERFEIEHDANSVWAVLSDPRSVVQCVPGASLGDERADGSFDGALTATLGPSKVTFRGTVAPTFESIERRGSLVVNGIDERGRSRAQVQTTFFLEASGTGPPTVLTLEADVAVTGGIAPFVRTGGVRLARRLLGEFADNLRRSCESSSAGAEERVAEPVAPPSVGRMLGRTILDLIAELVGRMLRSVRR